MFCGNKCMLSRFTVTMCVSMAVVGRKLRLLSRRPRDLWHWIFRHSVLLLGANYCNIFYDCNSFGSLGEVFAHGGEFPLSFSTVVGLGHEFDKYITDPSLKSPSCEEAGKVFVWSLQLWKLRVVSGYRPNMGYLRVDCWTGQFARVVTPPCP